MDVDIAVFYLTAPTPHHSMSVRHVNLPPKIVLRFGEGPWANSEAALDNLIDGAKQLYLCGRSAYLRSVSSKRACSHSGWWLGSGGALQL